MSKLDDILEGLENSVQRDVANRANGSHRQLKAPKHTHFEAKQAFKALMLEIYQQCRDKTRNEHELDRLFSAAVESL